MKDYFKVIQEAQENAKKGGFNSIPWEFNRLTNEHYFPGWVPGKYYCVTANSSVGKTKILKYLVIYNTYIHWINSGKSYDWKVMWFALEESEQEFWLSMICLTIYIQSGGMLELTPSILLKQGKRELTKVELDFINRAEKSEFLKVLHEKVEVFDYIFNPTGIKKEVSKFFNRSDIGEEIKNEEGIIIGYKKKRQILVYVVTDHISLLHAEKNMGELMTERQTLKFFSETYCLNAFCKRYEAIVVNSHQQDQSKENVLFTTSTGAMVASKLEPSLDHLANNKELQRDYDVIISLFNPLRFEMPDHAGYKLMTPELGYGKNYRSLKFLKDRLAGLEGTRVGLYFNGATPYCEELPKLIKGISVPIPEYPNTPFLLEFKKQFKHEQRNNNFSGKTSK